MSVANRFWGSEEEKGGNSLREGPASHLLGKSPNNSTNPETTREQLERLKKIGSKAMVPAPRNIKETPKPEDIPTFEEFLEYILSTDLLGK